MEPIDWEGVSRSKLTTVRVVCVKGYYSQVATGHTDITHRVHHQAHTHYAMDPTQQPWRQTGPCTGQLQLVRPAKTITHTHTHTHTHDERDKQAL